MSRLPRGFRDGGDARGDRTGGSLGVDSEELDARIVALERDLEHGAGFLTERGVEILGDACAALPRERWAEELPRVAERVAAAKPAMAGLRNAVGLLLRDLLELGPDSGATAARELARRMTDGLRRVGDMAADNAAAALGPTRRSRRAATAPR